MSWREALRVALQALTANRLRSALTALGVLIGVMSVVLLVAIGQGARSEIIGRIEGLGSNLLIVLPGDGQFGGGAPSRSRLVIDDVERVERELVAGRGRVAGYVVGGEIVAAEGERVASTIAGVTAGYLDVTSRPIARGQEFSASDVATSRRVALLGPSVAERLFGTADPIGRTVTIGSIRFRVVGVLGRVGATAFGPDRDNEVIIPVTVAQRLTGAQTVDALFVRGLSTDTLADDRAVVERVVGSRLGEDEFTVLSQDELIGVFGDVLGILTTVLAAIAGISLVVGGVGVSNIMLVSVSERTREIGLRKALGARTRDITAQFLLEAVVLTFLGGLSGLALGVSAARVAAAFLPVPAEVTWWSVALALGVSIGVGITFGTWPARRAGRLDPVEALRRD